ncbi:hypothetical protein PaG_00665 [Moesziomyces aphidis]|uniref:Uncharacterized protein n=1 Tax=Moesziomyces aphidis TaxID=84754 RepID=W3VT45_MOEAP|nr:hypothetical protein PaG_00665 [Moesziomyces aphidis]
MHPLPRQASLSLLSYSTPTPFSLGLRRGLGGLGSPGVWLQGLTRLLSTVVGPMLAAPVEGPATALRRPCDGARSARYNSRRLAPQPRRCSSPFLPSPAGWPHCRRTPAKPDRTAAQPVSLCRPSCFMRNPISPNPHRFRLGRCHAASEPSSKRTFKLPHRTPFLPPVLDQHSWPFAASILAPTIIFRPRHIHLLSSIPPHLRIFSSCQSLVVPGDHSASTSHGSLDLRAAHRPACIPAKECGSYVPIAQ